MLTAFVPALFLLAQAAPGPGSVRDVVTPGTGADKEDQAREKLRAGLRLFEEYEFGRALDEFVEGNSLFPSSTFLLNIGLTLGRLNRQIEAIDYLERCLSSPDLTGDKRARAEKYLAEFRALVGTITMISSHPPGASVALDGRPLGHTPVSGRFYVAVGTHHVYFDRSGFLPLDRPLDIQAGESYTPEVTLLPRPIAQADKQKEALLQGLQGKDARRRQIARRVGWVALGVAGLSGAVGAGGAWLSARRSDEVSARSDTSMPMPFNAGTEASGLRAEKVGWVGGIIAGSAAVVAGIAFFVSR